MGVGIIGLVLALVGAPRYMKTALVKSQDFAAETSSR